MVMSSTGEKVQAEQGSRYRMTEISGNAPDILRKKTGQEEQSVYNEKSEVDQNSQKGYNPGKEAAKKETSPGTPGNAGLRRTKSR